MHDPSALLDRLERHATEASFQTNWRAVLRTCAKRLLSSLSPTLHAEATGWMAAADAYERGDLTADALSAVRVDAWHLHDQEQHTQSLATLSALGAIMYRLWPSGSDSDWHEAATHFFDFCEAAGMLETERGELLATHFASILRAPTATEPSAAGDVRPGIAPE